MIPKVSINQSINKGIAYVIMSDKAVFDRLVAYKKMNFENHQIEISPATAPKELEMMQRVPSNNSNSNPGSNNGSRGRRRASERVSKFNKKEEKSRF